MMEMMENKHNVKDFEKQNARSLQWAFWKQNAHTHFYTL
jgi:hypothetical protein